MVSQGPPHPISLIDDSLGEADQASHIVVLLFIALEASARSRVNSDGRVTNAKGGPSSDLGSLQRAYQKDRQGCTKSELERSWE